MDTLRQVGSRRRRFCGFVLSVCIRKRHSRVCATDDDMQKLYSVLLGVVTNMDESARRTMRKELKAVLCTANPLITTVSDHLDRLCGLVVRVPGFDSRRYQIF
jgi:hypothetical protein